MRRTVWLGLSMLFIVSRSIALQAEEPPAAPAADAAYQESETPASAANPVNLPDLSGHWSGSWISCVNGHRGPMNARFCRRCDGHYDVTFNGRFWKLIPFHYKTTLMVTGYDNNGRVYLSGSHFLGPVLGTFSYNAWADGCQFVAGYSSRKDNGQFVMSR